MTTKRAIVKTAAIFLGAVIAILLLCDFLFPFLLSDAGMPDWRNGGRACRYRLMRSEDGVHFQAQCWHDGFIIDKWRNLSRPSDSNDAVRALEWEKKWSKEMSDSISARKTKYTVVR